MADKQLEVKIEIIAKVNKEDWHDITQGDIVDVFYTEFPELEIQFVKKDVVK